LGSHNVRSLAHALALADSLGLPRGACEFQMLYGMADPIKEALVSLGQRVRVYTPYGQLLPGMAYLVRRLLGNTSTDSFLPASFTEHVPEEVLLMNPLRNAERGAMNDERSRNGSSVIDRRSSFHNEPLTDFSREEARQAMQEALGTVGRQLGGTYPLVIGG